MQRLFHCSLAALTQPGRTRTGRTPHAKWIQRRKLYHM